MLFISKNYLEDRSNYVDDSERLEGDYQILDNVEYVRHWEYNREDNHVSRHEYIFPKFLRTEPQKKACKDYIFFTIRLIEKKMLFDVYNIELVPFEKNVEVDFSCLLYIDKQRLMEDKNLILTDREKTNLERMKEVPFLYKQKYLGLVEEDERFEDDYLEKHLRSIELASIYDYDKNVFVRMLNIMYEDTYLSDFIKRSYTEYEYQDLYDFKEKFNDTHEYPEIDENIDDEDCEIKTTEHRNLYTKFKPIETKNLIYELNNWKEKRHHRIFIVYDPVNKMTILPHRNWEEDIYCVE